MISQSPDELPAVLFVDDEPKTCKHFTRLFAPRFRIITASDGLEAMNVFQEQIEDIGIIMTDQRMPNETGTEFLEKAALLKPSVKRILSTAYADVDAAVDAVNNGGIYRYITKPWEVAELEMTLIRAMELYLLERDRENLIAQNLTELAQLAIRERVHGLAALSVFKDAGIRHIAPAIGSLMELGKPASDPVAPEQWGSIYQSNRNFLDLTHSALPAPSNQLPQLDHDQTVSVQELTRSLDGSDFTLEFNPATDTAPDLPGPVASLSLHFENLLEGLSACLPQGTPITLQESKNGLTLSLPSTPVEETLCPLFSSSTDAPPAPCLRLAASIITWHHHGGQLQLTREEDTLIATLHILPPKNSPDPWQDLAADLVANASFWKRQS